MRAKINNNSTGETIPVAATAEHPASSYGQMVWVDEQGTAYFQVGMPNPLYC
jgi:hypothetical protein